MSQQNPNQQSQTDPKGGQHDGGQQGGWAPNKPAHQQGGQQQGGQKPGQQSQSPGQQQKPGQQGGQKNDQHR